MLKCIFSIGPKGEFADAANNTLLYKNSDDLNFFKTQTYGKILVMGVKTWLSLPSGIEGNHCLPNRTSVVAVKEGRKQPKELTEALKHNEKKQLLVMRYKKHFSEVLYQLEKTQPNNTYFIVGGANYIEEALRYKIPTEVYVTHFKEEAPSSTKKKFLDTAPLVENYRKAKVMKETEACTIIKYVRKEYGEDS